jgi:hypothetical protein
MEEREEVSRKRRTIMLNNREWEVRFGFSAWERIQEDFGDITNLAETMKKKGPSTMLTLFEVCLVVPESENRPSRDEIRRWLEEYDLGELMEMSKILMSCVVKSIPDSKGAKASPTQAKRK